MGRWDWGALERAGGLKAPVPGVVAKGWKRRAHEKSLESAYAVVDKRDGDIDRVTGKRVFAQTDNKHVWRTRHHLKPRSTHPELFDDPRNIIVVGWRTHRYLQAGALEVEGTDANKKLFFRWNRNQIPIGKEPFRIASKNRSAQRRRAA